MFVALVGFESNNKYEIKNSVGQNVFYAVEENDCLTRQCCGPLRSFTIRILDNFGQEVITVSRPLKCMSCFFPCCLQEVSALSNAHEHSVYWNTISLVLLHLPSASFALYVERRYTVYSLSRLNNTLLSRSHTCDKTITTDQSFCQESVLSLLCEVGCCSKTIKDRVVWWIRCCCYYYDVNINI